MSREIHLSVRALTEFLLHSGSIDNRFGGKERAPEGSRIHRMLQKREGPGYQPEVSLSLTTRREGFTYIVQGRADGILRKPGEVLVDEIKTTGCPAGLITEDFDRAHWGQAMCYGHFLCLKEGLEEVSLRLTYYQIDTEEIIRFERRCTAGELADFYDGLLAQYQRWAEFQEQWAALRTGALRDLAFPFPAYREGQRKLAAAVYRTIQGSGRLFCQAPTGIGKTMSTLFPALKAMGEGMGEKLVYLTAKTITRQAAEDAFRRLREQGLRLKTVTLTAKDKICFLEERDCNPESCPYADGYYDRINGALYALLQERDAFTRPAIEAWAEENRLCPFELSLDLTLWCDGIVCDYNYLFDPVACLKRLFSEGGGDYIFLIDEAHNLVDRSREMYSARLSKPAVLALRRKCKGERKLVSALGKVNQALLELQRRCDPMDWRVERERPEALLQTLTSFSAACGEWLEVHRGHPLSREILPFYFEVLFFLQIGELFDEHYAAYFCGAKEGLEAQLLCLDTSQFLDACMSRGRASILFSATLSPLDYYIEVLGGGKEARCCRLPSPFAPERLRLLVADGISTKYTVREKSLLPIAELLFAMISARPGNYLAFFPSYQYLRQVYTIFQERYPQAEALMQESGMDEEEREAFLDQFQADGASRLGFCVLGGVYSEGIDLRGERLIGAAVIGVGLPQVNAVTNLLKDYFDGKRGRGFDYSYRFPGMNKVLQAAGRVIRDIQDRGIVLLIDSRFSTPAYQELFPAHWDGWRRIRSASDLSCELQTFWQED